jgi:hypothetical protein
LQSINDKQSKREKIKTFSNSRTYLKILVKSIQTTNKTNKMKKIFSSRSAVCHKFNEQSQSEGRAGNIFFDTDTIYSYGYHYVLGQFISPEIIIINNTGYSNTTSKHIGILKSATRDKTQVFTMRAEPKRVAEQIRHNFAKLAHARKPQIYISEIINLYEGFVNSCKVLKENRFNSSFSVEALDETSEHVKEIRDIYEGLNTIEQAEQLTQIKETDKRLRKERAEREQAKKAERIEKFYNYETNYIGGLDFDLLRVSKCGAFVETSQRVDIPIKEAQRYYKLLKSGANMRGEKIAQYITKSFSEALNIGCHRIEKQEAERIGELILNS